MSETLRPPSTLQTIFSHQSIGPTHTHIYTITHTHINTHLHTTHQSSRSLGLKWLPLWYEKKRCGMKRKAARSTRYKALGRQQRSSTCGDASNGVSCMNVEDTRANA